MTFHFALIVLIACLVILICVCYQNNYGQIAKDLQAPTQVEVLQSQGINKVNNLIFTPTLRLICALLN